MICRLCNKEISAVGMAQHLKGNHKGYTNKKYYDEFLLKENENKCIKCGNITDFISITKGYKNKCNKCINHFSVKPYKKSIKTCIICGYESKVLLPHIQKTHNLTEKEYYDTYIKRENEGVCPVCNKPTVFLGLNKGYRCHCSTRCSTLDKKVQDKLKNTNQEKYGYDYAWLKPEIHEKAVKLSYSEDAQNKKKQTCLEHFGVEYNFQSENTKEKAKQTCLKKYGVEYISQAEIIKQHQKESFISHYGVDHNMKSKDGYEEYKKGVIKKYGVDHIMKIKDIRDKVWETRRSNEQIDQRLDENNL